METWREELYAKTYLAHHGVKGMKWGVRRYQPYGSTGNVRFKGKTAAEYTKALNKVENENAELRYRKARARRKSMSRFASAESARKWNREADRYDKMIKAGEKDTNRLLSDAKKAGYTINSTEGTTYKRSGRYVASVILLRSAIIPMAAYDVYKGNKYGAESVGIVKRKRYSYEV